MVELARPPSDPVRVALTAHGSNTARTGIRLVSKDIRIPSVLYEERPLYACRGVDHPWPVEPTERTLKAFELHEGQWLPIAGHEGRRAGELSPMLNNPNVAAIADQVILRYIAQRGQEPTVYCDFRLRVDSSHLKTFELGLEPPHNPPDSEPLGVRKMPPKSLHRTANFSPDNPLILFA